MEAQAKRCPSLETLKEVPANHTNDTNRGLLIRVIRVIRWLHPLFPFISQPLTILRPRSCSAFGIREDQFRAWLRPAG